MQICNEFNRNIDFEITIITYDVTLTNILDGFRGLGHWDGTKKQNGRCIIDTIITVDAES